MSIAINLLEFVRSGQSRADTLSLAEMQRLGAVQQEGALQWQINGLGDPQADRRNKLFFDLSISGAVAVTCQRCLEPVKLKVALQRRFLVAKTEQEADAVPLDDDSIEVVVGSEDFDVAALVEDEVILSLPLVPMHQSCRHPAGQVAGPILEEGAVAEKVSPFAVLDQLKAAASKKN